MVSNDRKFRRSKSYLDSFRHALAGIKTVVVEERNMRVHLFAAILVILFAVLFRVSQTEWLILTLCIASVLVLEIVNTAIERTVDTVTSEFMPEAKKSKRCCCWRCLSSFTCLSHHRIHYFYSLFLAINSFIDWSFLYERNEFY
ncbi:hypothetical protein MFLO_03420 [Listeria floridensis FSL S10-1187]|uniref:Diacylglycerol kinase n=1 Tax=Listeria floridensis FSL S10-1187 TaxID=1265817 RepID=A0ABN0RHG1_9LIST|nr:hypothetical protein MFLO_03420 [Listeria floridensis FSL S10-1187]